MLAFRPLLWKSARTSRSVAFVTVLLLWGATALCIKRNTPMVAQPAAQPSQAWHSTRLGTGSASAKNVARILDSYGKLPMSFEVNTGQTDSRVNFLSRGRGYTVFLADNEAVLAFREHSLQSVLRMALVGAHRGTRVSGLEELPGRSNYFIGNDPHKWHSEVATFAKVRYQQVYPGIDLMYHGHQADLEYDFVVTPGADPRVIRLRLEGPDRLQIDAAGDLLVHAGAADIRFHKPVLYQEPSDPGGMRTFIQGSYALTGEHDVAFEVGEYDGTKPLTIDPVLTYSTYLGGNGLGGYGYEYGAGVATDSAGNAYVTGETSSTDFPTTNAWQSQYGGGIADAFVTVFDPTGSTLIYSTYLGGSGWDQSYGIALDSANNAYVTGYTESTNFPTVNPIQPTCLGPCATGFVLELNPTGSTLIYSTYLGGSVRDWGYSIAADGGGNAYVTGIAQSPDFPRANALQPTYGGGDADAFVTKISPGGSNLIYSTFLGGSQYEQGSSIAADGAGNAYVTGITRSTDFPTAHPLQPTNRSTTVFGTAFVTKIDPAGSMLMYSTYLGGSNWEGGWGIAADSVGNAYVTGGTGSTDFPTVTPLQPTNQGQSDAFVAKIDPAGSRLIYSTYLGGSDVDRGSGIAVDGAGDVYLVGQTTSTNFPTVNPLQPVNQGAEDVFVAELDPTGSTLIYSTYLGGSGRDYGNGIAIDGAGNAYVTGETNSLSDFPLANPFQSTNDGPAYAAFVAKIAPDPR